jgi:hypothetical protein
MYNIFNIKELGLKPEEILEYLRKSRSDDPLLSVEEVLSKHETILDEWAMNNIGAVVPEANKFREVVSGETIEARPEVQKVLKLIESPKVKAILAVEVQRLSRGDLEDAGRIIKLLRYTDTLVVTPTKTYNLKDEYDRDAFERELKRGNEYLEYQKKIMGRGRLLAVQQGHYIGSISPYGYDKTIVLDGKKKCHTLRINEAEAPIVQMIFDLYVNEDMGTTNISNRLNSMGIKPRKSPCWTTNNVKDILQNPHYIGKIKWNYRKTIKVVENGEIISSRPKNNIEDYMLFDGIHQPIISEELFEAAQRKRGRNHRAKATTKLRNPLSGLVYCQCGRAMSYRTYVKNGVERSAPRLICDDQPHCKTSSCLYDELYGMVCDVLEKSIKDFKIEKENQKSNSAEHRETLIKRLQRKMEELERKEISQWEKYSEESMPKEIFEKLNKKVIEEKESVSKALEEALNTIHEAESYEEKIYHFTDALEALRNPEVSAMQKNRLLKKCIKRITYNKTAPNGTRCSGDITLDAKLCL